VTVDVHRDTVLLVVGVVDVCFYVRISAKMSRGKSIYCWLGGASIPIAWRGV
jgi:hypothetical protein